MLGDATYRDLRLGAPHGFRSQDLHFVFDSVRQTSGIPSALRFSKVFYRPHLETIKRQEDHAKALGDAVAEEWHKGLAALGKKTMTDSARWERWELHMPLGTDLAQVLRKYDSSFPRRPVEIQGRSAGVVGVPMPSFAANGKQRLFRLFILSSCDVTCFALHVAPSLIFLSCRVFEYSSRKHREDT